MPVTTQNQAVAQHDTPQWARVLKARFGVHSMAIDVPVWERVFDEDLNEWDNDELCRVLKWMQEPGQSWKKPDCAKDLVVATWTHRKAIRNAENMPVEDCDYCRKGWLDWYPDADISTCQTYEQVLDLLDREYMCSTICQCPMGQRWLKVCLEYDKADRMTIERVGMMSRAAYRQAGAVRRLKTQSERQTT